MDSIWKPQLGEDIYLDPDFARGLKALWLMNEGQGACTIADLSVNRYIGSLNGDPTWAGGKFGHCLNFDGTGDYVSATNITVASTKPFSVSLWIKPNAYESQGIISIESSDVTRNWELFMWSSGSGYVPLTWGSDDDPAKYTEMHPTVDFGSELVGVWSHFVLTFDGTNTVAGARLYRDGHSIAITSADSIANVGNVTRIGRLGTSSSYDYTGMIDNVMVYDRVLSASEVQQLYINPFWGIKRRPTTLMLWLPTLDGGVTVPVLAHQHSIMAGAL